MVAALTGKLRRDSRVGRLPSEFANASCDTLQLEKRARRKSAANTMQE